MAFGLLSALLGILLVATIALMGIFALLAIVRAVAPGRFFVAQPVCAKCRYSVGGLESHTCPECGGDLREVGILTPALGRRLRGSLWLGLLGWTFLWFGAGSFMGMIGLSTVLASQRASAFHAAAPEYTATLRPTSGVFESVEIETTDATSNDGVVGVEAMLTLNDGSTARLVIDETTGRATAYDTAGEEIAESSAPSDFFLRRWLEQCGVAGTLGEEPADLSRALEAAHDATPSVFSFFATRSLRATGASFKQPPGPFTSSQTIDYELEPISGAFSTARLRSRDDIDTGDLAYAVTLSLTLDDGATATLSMPEDSWEAEAELPGGQQARRMEGLSLDAFDEWVSSCGIDTTREDVRAEIDELHLMLIRAKVGVPSSPSNFVRTAASTSTTPAGFTPSASAAFTTTTAVSLAIWLVIYIGGIIGIVWCRRFFERRAIRTGKGIRTTAAGS